MRSQAFSILTTGGGAFTGLGEVAVNGRLIAVQLVLGTLASGTVDLTLTVENQGGQGLSVPLLIITDAAASGMYYPRAAACNNAGVALTYNGTQTIEVFPILSGSLKLVVAQGGAAASGGLVVYYATED